MIPAVQMGQLRERIGFFCDEDRFRGKMNTSCSSFFETEFLDIPSLAEKGERFHGITCELNLRLLSEIKIETN
jgi:hypothetical protein